MSLTPTPTPTPTVMTQPIRKTVQKKEDLFIEFTDQEMQTLNIAPHDKFEIEVQSDTTLILKKFEKIDIDLGEFDKKTLELLIVKSIEEQIPVDSVITGMLTDYLNTLKAEDKENLVPIN